MLVYTISQVIKMVQNALWIGTNVSKGGEKMLWEIAYKMHHTRRLWNMDTHGKKGVNTYSYVFILLNINFPLAKAMTIGKCYCTIIQGRETGNFAVSAAWLTSTKILCVCLFTC